MGEELPKGCEADCFEVWFDGIEDGTVGVAFDGLVVDLTVVATVPERPGNIDSKFLPAAATLEEFVAVGILAVLEPPGKISTPSFTFLSHQLHLP